MMKVSESFKGFDSSIIRRGVHELVIVIDVNCIDGIVVGFDLTRDLLLFHVNYSDFAIGASNCQNFGLLIKGNAVCYRVANVNRH